MKDNIVKTVENFGAYILNIIRALGNWFIFSAQALRHIFSLPLQVNKFFEQIYFIGVRSISIIVLVALFTGMVLGLQGYYTLLQFNSVTLLGALVSRSLIQELGPVFTAIMIVGRAGSSIAAEIGIMRISDQIDALETMDINSVRYLISPKLLAAIISFPLLTAIFDVVGIAGGYLASVKLLDLSSGAYFFHMESSIQMHHVVGGFLKSIAFSIIVATICCYQGYFTHRRTEYGAKGVSLSTTSAVVLSCVAILVADYALTSFLL